MGGAPPYALVATRPRDDLISGWSARLPKVAVEGVLDDLDRAATRCSVPGAAAGEGFTWDEFDRTDSSWWPQGVASISAADLLLVSWYARRRWLVRTHGSRVSVIDRRDPGAPRYRHVLLVVPHRRLGILGMRAVPVHAGGIAVRGDLLYVADTLLGVRLFRLGDVLRLARPPSPGRGEPRRGWSDAFRGSASRGYGVYAYALPQLMAFRVPLRSGRRRLRYSFLSIGEVEGRPNLVVGEYRRADGRPPRLARYALDPRTGLPAADEQGRCAPLEVYEDQPRRMQGVAVHESTWFVTASAGEKVDGDLYVGAPGTLRRHRRVLPSGPEDLEWSRPGAELWCLSEWPGRRWVFPIAAGRWLPLQHPTEARGQDGGPARS